MHQSAIQAFLRAANKSTYAASGKKVNPPRLNSEDFEYREGDLLYHDTYFGDDRFIGEEIIYEKEMPIWGMNYYGYLVDDSATPKEVYSFLKQALMAEENEAIPVRGPKTFVTGEYAYAVVTQGAFDNFTGEERIERLGMPLYKAFFHGGSIKGKE